MHRTVLQLTRLTNSGRLSDRFLACQVREVYDETGDRGMSRLMMVIDIQRPWLTASQIGQALMHAFTTGYREEVSEDDDVKRVEAALKRVNETLVHLTQQGETEWIGHLHAVFVVEIGGQIHVAHTGRAGAFLAREGSLSRVTELEGSQSATTANRTFANITSGTLQGDDSLLIGSSEFLRAVGADTIEETLADRTSAEAANRFVRILRQHQTRGAAGIVVRAYDPLVLESQPLIPEPDVLYLDQDPGDSLGATLRSLSRRGQKLAFAARQQFGHVQRRTAEFVQTSLAPKSKEFAEKSRAASSAGWKKFTTETIPGVAARIKPMAERVGQQSQQLAGNVGEAVKTKLNQPPAASNQAPPMIPVNMSDDQGLIGKDLYTVRYYNDRSQGFSIPFTKLHIKIPAIRWQGLAKVITILNTKRNHPRVYIGIAAVLILILSINIYVLRAKQNNQLSATQAVATLATYQEQFDTIKLQITLKKSDQSGSLNDLLQKVQPLTSNSAVSDRATTLANAIEDAIDTQTNTIHVRNPKTIATFTNASGIWRLGSDVVTTQSGSNGILSSPIAGQLIDDQAKLPDGTSAIAGTTLDQSHNLALLTKNGLVKMTNPGQSPATVALSSGNWESAVAMSSFGDNLYLLDASGNQIWKHATASGGYTSGSGYVTDGTSVGNGISLAIDGSIYVLKTDGSVQKLTGGKKDNFSITGLPASVSLANARAIWTSQDANSIYILTTTGVVELSKTGGFTHAYLSSSFTNLTAFIIDPTAKQAWVLNDSTVFQFDLTGA